VTAATWGTEQRVQQLIECFVNCCFVSDSLHWEHVAYEPLFELTDVSLRGILTAARSIDCIVNRFC
jgi:hypothetical protein